MSLSLLVADLSVILIARARAQSAADAAALAAAAELLPGSKGSPGWQASRFADLNGARIVVCRCEKGSTAAEVRVETPVRFLVLGSLGVDSIGASARAEAELSGILRLPD